MTDGACIAYTGRPICRNGFTVVPLCRGSVCHACGQPTSVPACLRDSVPAHLSDERGRMVLREAGR